MALLTCGGCGELGLEDGAREDPATVACAADQAPVCLGELSVACDTDGAGLSVVDCAAHGLRCASGRCVDGLAFPPPPTAAAPSMPISERAAPEAAPGPAWGTPDAVRISPPPAPSAPGLEAWGEPGEPEPARALDGRAAADARVEPDTGEGLIVIRDAETREEIRAAAGRGARGCPRDMVLVEDVCMDRYEAPNRRGSEPLVMYSFDDSLAWCQARGKRLCYDDEWTRACAGPSNWAYPYGATRQPGRCNDDKVWRRYDGARLRQWPGSASGASVGSLEQLYAQAGRTESGADAVAHVQELYQGTPGGQKRGCGGHYGVYDLVGNVEEWTRRRDGSGMFQGRLKGRFWGEARTCQSGVSNHGNAFRFYETGFRCCMDPLGD